MEQLLSHSLLENKLALRQLFGQSVDFYTKDIQICGLACCICMFEGLSSIERLWVMLLDTASREPLDVTGPEQLYEYLLKGSAVPLEPRPVTCPNLSGFSPSSATISTK